MERRGLGLILVTAGTVLWSLAGLFVRAVDLNVWDLILWRSIFASLCLFAIALMRPSNDTTFGWKGLLAALLSAIAMFCYVASLTLTTVANVLIIYATLPFVAAGLTWIVSKERASKRLLMASTAALVGIAFVAGTALTGSDVIGNALALVMTCTFGALLVVIRFYGSLNIIHVNATAALLCACAALPFTSGHVPDAYTLFIIFLLAFLTTALAFLFFLFGGRHIASSEAALIALLDVILGPLWVWIGYAENPGYGAMIGGLIVLLSVTWYFWPSLRKGKSTVECKGEPLNEV
ncbi:MAG: DMT family transporter [Alphaproteobacteria bacterium]|nr:DMT family transporter [Alphaproteobacteria bacterium]